LPYPYLHLFIRFYHNTLLQENSLLFLRQKTCHETTSGKLFKKSHCRIARYLTRGGQLQAAKRKKGDIRCG